MLIFFFKIVLGAGLEPARSFLTRGFSYYFRFYTNPLQHYLFRGCSLDYFFTYFYNPGATYIVSTPFINITIELSEPSPKQTFLYARLPFVRAVLLLRLGYLRALYSSWFLIFCLLQKELVCE